MKSLRLQPILTATVTTLIVLALWAVGMLEAPERATLSARLLIRGPLSPPANVTIVAIDESSLASFGQMPWDRRLFARLLDRLRSDHVRAVGIDVAFNEPGRIEGEDGALELAMAKLDKVVLPAYSTLTGKPTLFKPLPRLERVAIALGLAQFNTAYETMALEPFKQEGGAMLPTFGLALARTANLQVPSLEGGYLNPLGPAHHFRELNFAEALQAPPGTFRDQVVLVGATAQGLPDTGFSGPFMAKGRISGVELHATALTNLMTGGMLRRLPGIWSFWGLLLLGMAPGAWLASDKPALLLRRILGTVCLLALILALGQVGIAKGWWLEMIPALLSVLSCFVVGLAFQHRRLLSDRNRLLEWYAFDLAREAKRERERIDGELHDEAQQLVIALGRDLRRIKKLFEQDPERASARLEGAEDLSKRILDEIMRVRKALMPHALERSGLRPAIEEMLQDYSQRVAGLKVQFEAGPGPQRWDGMLESELYWLLKESLNNALKHAHATEIRVTLAQSGSWVTMGIEDNGAGFEVPDLEREPSGPEHSGLHRMWLRVQALRGTLEIRSVEGQGTRIDVRVLVKEGHHG